MLSLRTTLVFVLAISSVQALAGPRELGKDYRILRSNYTMLENIVKKCPEVELPEMVSKERVNNEMQKKIGADQFTKLFVAINKSDLKKNAIATVEKLFQNIEGCEDPELGRAIGRIQTVHEQAYARFQAEPGIVSAPAVPVPLRRPE